MLDHLLKLIGDNKYKKFTQPKVEEAISTIKSEHKKVEVSSMYGEFIGDFEYPSEKKRRLNVKRIKPHLVLWR